MISEQLVEDTKQRFEKREPQRAQTAAKAKVEGATPLTIDTPVRVRKYLARRGLTDVLEALPRFAGGAKMPCAATSHLPQTERLLYERILGTNDLMAVRFLERGARAAQAVGRVRVRDAGGDTVSFGTGSLISPRLLLTNNHVLAAAGEARTSWIEMGYQESSPGKLLAPLPFELDPDTFFETSEELDFTVVAVKESAIDGTKLARFGFVRLIEEEGKVLLRQTLNIIQHPNGEPKQVALRQNELIDILPNFLHYETDTAPGSSGSLVCSDEWEVVALHHSGVPEPHPDGGYMATDGTRWQPSMGEHRLKWIANEGVRVSRILKNLKSRALAPEARALLNEVFSPSEPEGAAASVMTVGADGSAGLLHADPPTVSALAHAQSHGQGHTQGPAQAVQITISIPFAFAAGAAAAGVAALGAAALAPSVTVGNGSRPAEPIVVGPTLGGAALTGAAAGAGVTDQDVSDALAALAEARRQPYYSKVQDEADVEAYYDGLDTSLDPDDLYDALRDILESTHAPELRYKPMTHVYPWVDLQPDLKLRSIYSGQKFEPEDIIREDFRVFHERLARAEAALRVREGTFTEAQLAREVDLLEASLPYNCEHVVPQSWFGKREPMRGDLHHLFTCESGCNSFRGNTPYFDFADFEEAVRDECGKREANKFEPGNGKGAVARASLYFLLRYAGEVNDAPGEYARDRLEVLLDWHESFPVNKWERHRNSVIFRKQGNRNPLIDFPHLARRIAFARGLG